MENTINMQDLRHLNLFSKITKVETRFCFMYNETLMFCVPKFKLPQALGQNGSNLRRISTILKKRIRILPRPRDIGDAKNFISAIISPASFKEIEVNDKEIVINAGSTQNKATLFGRNKKRFEEMKKIISNFFDREYRLA
jgi:NusA-like KH domain protein